MPPRTGIASRKPSESAPNLRRGIIATHHGSPVLYISNVKSQLCTNLKLLGCWKSRQWVFLLMRTVAETGAAASCLLSHLLDTTTVLRVALRHSLTRVMCRGITFVRM